MEKYDVIIIGGGLGGLTSGAKLSKEGKKVLLLEQHSAAGGYATTFKRGDFNMEVSLHELDGLENEDSMTEIFKELEVFDRVKFVKIPEFYKFSSSRISIAIPDNTAQAKKILLDKFPEDRRGIIKFFKTVHGISREFDRIPLQRWKFLLMLPLFPLICPKIFFNRNNTLGKFLDSITENEDLKLVLEANVGYYHDDPYSLSLLFFSLAQSSYYSGGAHYIKGGSQKLSNHLLGIIKKNGGEVLLGRLVSKIITKENMAVGVEYRKKTGRHNKIQKAFGQSIISNAAIPNVAHKLLDPPASSIIKDKIKGLKNSCSILSIYFGFKKPVKDLGNRYYSTIIVPESLKKQSDWIKNFKNGYDRRGFFFVDYSQVDSGLAPDGKSVGTISTLDYLYKWENLTKEEYKEKKERVAKIFIDRLDEEIPGIRSLIEHYEVGTPKTMQRYTLNPGGSVYGYAQIPSQAGMNRLPNKSPVENLYFASAWAFPGGGFSAAIFSGYLCALEVLKNNK